MILIDASYRMENNEPVVLLYGSTSNRSRVVRVKGFRPYCYVQTDSPSETMSYAKGLGCDAEIVMRYLPIGYQSKETPVVKITAWNPMDIRMIRDDIRMLPSTINVFDADIPFRTRFMIDNDVYGMHWYDFHEDTVDIPSTSIHGTVPEWFRPEQHLSIMCFDIECITDGKSIPTPDRFPVIIISISVNRPERLSLPGDVTNVLLISANDQNKSHIRNHVPSIENSVVVPCSDEKELITKFIEIVSEYDPDIITGYNINTFDFPYLMERAGRLNVMMRIGRSGGLPKLNSEMNRVTIEGRVVVDLLPLVRKNYRLQRYNLETAAAEITGEKKHDMKHSEIAAIWSSDRVGTLIDYAIQDAVITLKILLKSGMLEKYVALAQLTGNLLQDVIDGGQTVMIEMAIMREFFREGRMVSMRPEGNEEDDESYQGAYVLTPKPGLVEDVIILDFKSLYPTIMISHNLCYTTIMSGTRQYSDGDADRSNTISTVNSTTFVSHNVYTGVIPRILQRLLEERIRIKNAMKTAPDDAKGRLDAKQYALKILLNSFYGYTGYKKSRLYCSDIASTVTAIGRHNLERTRQVIESMSDDTHKFEVVYGDTDSVFVRLKKRDCETKGCETKDCEISEEEAMRLGEIIAKEVTRHLPHPMELVYEAYARRGIFLSKKRYAMYLPSENKIKIRGIETVRRDWCPLVSSTLNECLRYILIEGDIDAAVRHVQNTIRSLYHVDEDMISQITLTKTYSKDAREYRNVQPHVQLVKKMQARDGYTPSVGDRISYVVTAYGRTLADKAEDPEYVVRNRVPIDIDYYIHKQILPPAYRLLKHFGVSEDRLCHAYDTRSSMVKTAQTDLFSFV